MTASWTYSLLTSCHPLTDRLTTQHPHTNTSPKAGGLSQYHCKQSMWPCHSGKQTVQPFGAVLIGRWVLSPVVLFTLPSGWRYLAVARGPLWLMWHAENARGKTSKRIKNLFPSVNSVKGWGQHHGTEVATSSITMYFCGSVCFWRFSFRIFSLHIGQFSSVSSSLKQWNRTSYCSVTNFLVPANWTGCLNSSWHVSFELNKSVMKCASLPLWPSCFLGLRHFLLTISFWGPLALKYTSALQWTLLTLKHTVQKSPSSYKRHPLLRKKTTSVHIHKVKWNFPSYPKSTFFHLFCPL